MTNTFNLNSATGAKTGVGTGARLSWCWFASGAGAARCAVRAAFSATGAFDRRGWQKFRPLKAAGDAAAQRPYHRVNSLLSGFILAASLILGTANGFATEDAPLDFQVEAAFLVNFPKYVDWPSATFTETNSPITIGIFGDDNVASEFENMIAGGRTIAGHPLRLKRINKEDQIGADCQILFIASSERQRAQAILVKAKG